MNEKVKEKFNKVLAAFNLPVIPAAPAAAAEPPAQPAAPAGTAYTLSDGSTISIVQAGAVPAIGDAVTINGLPAPEGTLALSDGSAITVDAMGIITVVTPAAAGPVTTDAGAAPPAPVQPAPTPQQLMESAKTAIEKFAGGSPEERIANLEIVAKAVMEYCYGWQIAENERLASTNSAIEVYKTSLKAATDKIELQEGQLKAMFEMMEEIVAVPSADPRTVPPARGEKLTKKEERLNKIAEGFSKFKKETKV